MEKSDAMHGMINRLFPPPGQEVGLPGLYLDHRLHTRGGHDRPYVCLLYTSDAADDN